MSTLDDIQNFGGEKKTSAPKKDPTGNNAGGGDNNNGFYKKNDGSAWVNNQDNNTTTQTLNTAQTATKVEDPKTKKVETTTQTATDNGATTPTPAQTTNTTPTTEQNDGTSGDEEIGDNDYFAYLRKKQKELEKNDNPTPTEVDKTKTISAVQKQAQESAAKARNFEKMIADIYDAEMKRNALDNDPEKEKKERKRQKRNELFAAIGDGISALANMWGTYHGAQNMWEPKNSMSDRVRKRYEQIKAEKEKKRQNYLNAANGKYQILRGRENADAGRADAETNANIAQYKAQRQAQKDADDKEYKDKKLGIDAAGVQAKINSANQNYELGKERNAIADRHNRASEQIASARESRLANGGGSKSSGEKDYRTLTLRNGQVVQYHKRYIGALNRLAPTMAQKARAAAERYYEAGDMTLGDHFDGLANSLETVKSTDGINSLVASNIADFPSMQDQVRQILGISKGKQSKASNTQAAPKKKFDPKNM